MLHGMPSYHGLILVQDIHRWTEPVLGVHRYRESESEGVLAVCARCSFLNRGEGLNRGD